MRDTVPMPPYVPYPPRQFEFIAGECMRAIRRAYGYSRADFATFLGVEPEQLKRWEEKDKLQQAWPAPHTERVRARCRTA
jgi:predicted transcriptional regulator